MSDYSHILYHYFRIVEYPLETTPDGKLDIEKYVTPHTEDNHVRDDIAAFDDELIVSVLYRTLNWIPTFNPSTNEPCEGFNLYGLTLIRQEGITLTRDIFTAWANLFALGPEEFTLSGSYGWTEGEDPCKGEYEKIQIVKKEILGQFRKFNDFCNQVIGSNGKQVILHEGI